MGIDRRFTTSAVWSSVSVMANVVIGILLAPYILRHLGDERYGVWALTFSLLEYLWFFDLGFMSAIANLCTRYVATGNREKLNLVLNTAIFYFSAVGLVVWIITLAVYK